MVIIERVKTTTVLGCIVMLYFAKFKISETKLIAIDSALTISKVLLKLLISNVF